MMVNAFHSNTLTIPPEFSGVPTTRRLSQTISDIVTGSSLNTTRSKSGSCAKSPSPAHTERPMPTKLSIQFEGGTQMIVRPNRIVRGAVHLKTTVQIQASQIRIRFRAEETATVKVKEHGLESKIERIDQSTTTYFDVSTKVWGTEPSAYLMSPWEMIEPGEHEYPFALKFPNVNFPPSTDDPAGFSIHYIWSAHLDGPASNPGAHSKEYMMPYRPVICAPPTKEWTFTQTAYHLDKKTPLADVKAVLPRRAFCPDEDVDMELCLDSIPSDLVVSNVLFTLNKCHTGQLQLQRGLALKSKVRKILSGCVPVAGNKGSIRLPINFHVPTRLVSPSFCSRHIRVYYEMTFAIQFTNHGGLLKSTPSTEFSVPIGITNLPHNHLLNIPHLTSVQSYLESKEAPVFFDPFLDEPPSQSSIISNELWGPLTAALTTPPISAPPNYFSLPDLPSQFIPKDREERTTFTSRLIKPGMAQELGDTITVVSENKGYEW
ncbi:hypothetical protein [Parasitella parasitica]|uniref:Uncharacterized protein n=1 Tax=Parasitella parasitica TaxID=35722 RepID=A0A0B7MY01_9FUNG|nr:hypothetical protein [Parasitella parasitica]